MLHSPVHVTFPLLLRRERETHSLSLSDRLAHMQRHYAQLLSECDTTLQVCIHGGRTCLYGGGCPLPS